MNWCCPALRAVQPCVQVVTLRPRPQGKPRSSGAPARKRAVTLRSGATLNPAPLDRISMEIETILFAFGVFIVGVLIYVVYRLASDPRPDVEARSARIARWFGYPRFFDPLFAMPLTKREKIGWLIVVVIMISAFVFDHVTGTSVRGR